MMLVTKLILLLSGTAPGISIVRSKVVPESYSVVRPINRFRTLSSISSEPVIEIIDSNQFFACGSSLLVEIEGTPNKDNGIYHGDLVIIDRDRTPKQNDIVIECVGGDYAVTRFQADARRGLRLVTDQLTVETPKVYGVARFIIKKVNELYPRLWKLRRRGFFYMKPKLENIGIELFMEMNVIKSPELS